MKKTKTFKIDPEAEAQLETLAKGYFFGNKSHAMRECVKFAYNHQRGFKRHIKERAGHEQ